jgi:hypothetical protein
MSGSDENGWIAWSGGECPVPPKTIVLVQFQFNSTLARRPRPADLYNWGWPNPESGGNIIAYRIEHPAIPSFSTKPHPEGE